MVFVTLQTEDFIVFFKGGGVSTTAEVHRQYDTSGLAQINRTRVLITFRKVKYVLITAFYEMLNAIAQFLHVRGLQ